MKKTKILVFVFSLLFLLGFSGCNLIGRNDIKGKIILPESLSIVIGQTVDFAYILDDLKEEDITIENLDKDIYLFDKDAGTITGLQRGEGRLQFFVKGEKSKREIFDITVDVVDRTEYYALMAQCNLMQRDDFTNESFDVFDETKKEIHSQFSHDDTLQTVAAQCIRLQELLDSLVFAQYDKAEVTKKLVFYNKEYYRIQNYNNFTEISAAVVELNTKTLYKSEYEQRINKLINAFDQDYSLARIQIYDDLIIYKGYFKCSKSTYTTASFENLKSVCLEIVENITLTNEQIEERMDTVLENMINAITILDGEVRVYQNSWKTYKNNNYRDVDWEDFLALVSDIDKGEMPEITQTGQAVAALDTMYTKMLRRININDNSISYLNNSFPKQNYLPICWKSFYAACSEINERRGVIDQSALTALVDQAVLKYIVVDFTFGETSLSACGNQYNKEYYRLQSYEVFKTECERIRADETLNIAESVKSAVEAAATNLVMQIRIKDDMYYFGGTGSSLGQFTKGSQKAFIEQCNIINADESLTTASVEIALNSAKTTLLLKISIDDESVRLSNSVDDIIRQKTSYRTATYDSFKEACALINENESIVTTGELKTAYLNAAENLIGIIVISEKTSVQYGIYEEAVFMQSLYYSYNFTVESWAAFKDTCAAINTNNEFNHTEVVEAFEAARTGLIRI